MSGDQQVQKAKDNVMYGFYEFNDIPRQFKSSQDYLAYKKGLLSNKKSPNVIAPGDVAATMSLLGARDISNVFVGNEEDFLDDDYARLPIAMDFYFNGVNYGKWQNGGIYWCSNNILCFGAGLTNVYDDISGGDPGIYLGTGDRVIDSVYIVDTVKEGNFNIFKLIVNYYNYDPPFETGSFELRLVKEASGFFRQWIEVKTRQANNTTGHDDGSTYPAIWNILFESPDSAPEKNGPQYTFGTVYEPSDRSSFVLASDPTGTTWKLFDHAHLTI